MYWSRVDYLWIIVTFLSAVWTLILTAPIHCGGSGWASDVMLNFSKSVPMKKLIFITRGGVNIFIFGWTTSLWLIILINYNKAIIPAFAAANSQSQHHVLHTPSHPAHLKWPPHNSDAPAGGGREPAHSPRHPQVIWATLKQNDALITIQVARHFLSSNWALAYFRWFLTLVPVGVGRPSVWFMVQSSARLGDV